MLALFLLFPGYPFMTPVGEQQPGEPCGSAIASSQKNSLPCVGQNCEREECIYSIFVAVLVSTTVLVPWCVVVFYCFSPYSFGHSFLLVSSFYL